jgi:hypothetical protein
VVQRAKRRCEYCQLAQICSNLSFEIDHIIARKHGGRTVASNLALSCFYCNTKINTSEALCARQALIEEGVFPPEE